MNRHLVRTIPGRGIVALAGALLIAGTGTWAAASAATAATVAAASGTLEPTPDVGRGPNHSPGAPYRAKLSPPFAKGTTLVIKGRVRAADTGKGLSGVVLEPFHADADGAYDMDGYNYRGRVLTDETGYYEFETIRPRGYSGLRAHIHFVITRPGYRTLATELRFREDLPASGRGNHPGALLIDLVKRQSNGRGFEEGTFDIVLQPER